MPTVAAFTGSAPTRRPQTGGRPRALPLPELVVRPAPLTRVSNALLTTAAWKESAPTRRPQTGGRPRALPSPRTWSFGLRNWLECLLPCPPPQRERDLHRHGGRRQAVGRGLSLYPNWSFGLRPWLECLMPCSPPRRERDRHRHGVRR